MIIKLQPAFVDKLWGGNKLHQDYGYDCSDSTGEAWGISTHMHGLAIIKNGPYKGTSFKELFETHRELFGNYPGKEFPILIKLIHAEDDLSIQVHPDDAYARKYENSFGKTECWYILDAEKNTEIIIGHNMNSKQEFIEEMEQNNWDRILHRFPIHKDDSFCVRSGTIHAICKGTLLLEIQQSSDVTYRLYDYDRKYKGKHRELHIDKALDVISFPSNPVTSKQPTHLFDFTVDTLEGSKHVTSDQYGDYIFIMDGIGSVNSLPLKKGDFVFISANEPYDISGTMKYFTAHIK